MDERYSLGDFERLLLLAVIRRSDEAYGYTLQQELKNSINRNVTLGAIYTTLERMERKGLVSSRFGEGTPGRGGRPRRLFKVEVSGLRALASTQREWTVLSAGLEEVLGTAWGS